MSPAEDFADKCARIMNELREPMQAPKPIRIWMTQDLYNHLFIQNAGVTAATLSNGDIEIIRNFDFVPTGMDIIQLDECFKPLLAETKSKNPMASQQAWKKKHRR